MHSKPIAAILALLSAFCIPTNSFADDGTDFFENKIRPVLIAKCYQCHSAKAAKIGKLKGGLMLDDRDALRRGGESGPAVVPGNEKQSLLLAALKYQDLEMPPKGKLPDTVIADFAKWIKMGAPDPRAGKGVITRSIDLEKGREFWCFQPVRKPDAPQVKDAAWSKSAIDRFVAASLERKELKPVDAAGPEALVRRLNFDLIGLPPSTDDLKKWSDRLASAKSDDFNNVLGELVDSLLDSPRFGERWGRHWLDVARYAESNGNSRNATFPHAWRYRDYVIDAFNADTPYDRFVTEQIAGDLLPHENIDERNRNLVATGFLALGSKPVIRGKQGGFVPDIAVDQIEVTSRAVLGLTVACARCHDHKFDPIPTTDYYGLAGIFASSQTLYGGGNSMGGAPATGLHVLVDKDPAKQKAYEQWQKKVDATTKRQREINSKLKKLRPRRRKNKKKRGKIAAADAKPATTQPQQIAELQKEQRQIGAELKKLRANSVEPPDSAMGIRDAAKVTEVPVYVRGESAKGSPVSRRLISVATRGDSLEFPTAQSGRLELAGWLASPENPLTARVMINRIWKHLFGEGIVRTPDNFGLNGDRPTHPELLDHLAATFVADSWSMKRMIRRLVLTQTYRLSDSFDAGNYQADPDNVYLWRHTRRRLEAEPIRDAILAISGQLDLDRPHGSVVTVHGGKLIQDALTPDKIHKPSNHRSVYLPILRNGLPESLEVFDLADPSLVVGRRSVTTVPAQDLYLLNNAFVVENARAFAERMLKASENADERIDLAYRTALSRSPSVSEKRQALTFIEEIVKSLESNSDNQATAWTGFCQALIVSAEFRHVR